MTCSGQKDYSHKELNYFFSAHFTTDFNRFIPPVIHVVWYKKRIENRYTCQNIQLFNKIPHDLPSHCKYLRVSLLIIKKKAIIFTADRKTPQRNTTVSQENMKIFTRTGRQKSGFFVGARKLF